MNSNSVASQVQEKQSNKFVVIFAIIGVLMLLAIVAVIAMLATNSNNNTNTQTNNSNNQQALILPDNTCPESLTYEDSRPVAIYQGNTVQMSANNYSWVQQNCDFSSNRSADGRIAQIVLTNLGIDIGKYDEMTGRAGAIIFDKEALEVNIPYKKIFIEFGETVTKSDGDLASKTFPEMVYNQVDADTNITSLSDGTVFAIDEQLETNDYSMTIMYNDFWTVNYDHIINLTVTKGESVKAGQILGKVSINRDGITGYTEIQVKYVLNGGRGAATSYCPVSLLSNDVKADYMSKLTTLMEDWETYYGDSTIYNETAQVVPGCVQETYQE